MQVGRVMRAFYELGPRKRAKAKFFKECAVRSFVVADSVQEARETAAEAGGEVFLNEIATYCEELKPQDWVCPAVLTDEVPCCWELDDEYIKETGRH